MARIEDLRLDDRGRKRRTTMVVTGTVVFEEAEASFNNVELRISFFGQDRGDDDRLANNVALIVKSRSDRFAEGGDSTWTLTATASTRTDFRLVRDSTGGFLPARTFNEDIPGRDEVYAMAVIRDPATTDNISEWVRSNTVTGRY